MSYLIKKHFIKQLAVATFALATTPVWVDDSKTQAAPEVEVTSTNLENTVSDSNAQQVRKPEGNVEDFWNAQEWSGLNSAEQALWEKLGWTEMNWEGDDIEPPSENKTWAELSNEERTAAEQLSYTEEVWNLDLIRQTDADVENFWDSLDWSDLTPAEQALWGKLGWTQESWEGEAQVPDSEDKEWKALSEEEREVAQKLGYNENSWDDSGAQVYINIFNWWETLFPSIFVTEGFQNMEIPPYIVRFYPATQTYIGFNPEEEMFYVYNPAIFGADILPAGSLAFWSPLVEAAGF